MPTTVPSSSRHRRRHGLTVAELSIGLVITSMVMAALASTWHAVASAWAVSGGTQGAGLTASVTVSRIEQRLRASRYVFQYASGSITTTPARAAAIFYWKADNWNATADGVCQLGEMALIEHDATTKRLYLYEPIAAASMTTIQRTAAGVTATTFDMTDASSPTNFKQLSFVSRAVLTEAVPAVAFNMPAQTTGGRPLIEFTLKVARPEGTLLFYGSCAQRAAARPN